MSGADTSNLNGSEATDLRPTVARKSPSNWGVWIFTAILLIGGVMLYNALSAAEETSGAPSVLIPEDGAGPDQARRLASPPDLRIPDRLLAAAPASRIEQPQPNRETLQPQTLVRPIIQPIVSPPIAAPLIPAPIPQDVPNEPAFDRPEVVFEASAQPRATSTASREGSEDERVTASRLRNPSRTVPQGTVIPAVLETALDSTRAGGVRALVQRDVSSFDGTRILIPRGSRLYGEYESNLQSGQNRALVQWTRLIRPDGVTIALNSPSSDPLGRAGIRGRVDTKFLQRFGGAILQSVLDIGVGLAVNEASDGVIVALPGSTQNLQITDPQSIQPTLRVRHGASVSVFVARDLDFSSVDP